MIIAIISLFVQSLFIQPRTINHFAGLHTSSITMAEPLKKKKRVGLADSQIQVTRKVRRIEKEIKRLNRLDRILRPIEEIEGDRQLKKEIKLRQRPSIDISETELDERIGIWKNWTRYQRNVAHNEMIMYNSAIAAQQNALKWLYKTSPDLYKAAIQPCPELIQSSELSNDDNLGVVTKENEMNYLTLVGPYMTAPKLHGEFIDSTEEYEPPDGEQIDTTIQLTYEFEIEPQLLAQPKKRKFMFTKK
uniref:Large ribosomal subunit protein mL40 n=1 Tax=Schistosoma haematobium TaxID=6185 RepID=A0A095C6F5_SCHHA